MGATLRSKQPKQHQRHATHTHTYTHFHTHSTDVTVQTCACTRTHARAHTHTQSHTRARAHTHTHTQVLWVPRCGLSSLDGISAMPALRELYAAFNDISDLQPLDACASLEVCVYVCVCVRACTCVWCDPYVCMTLCVGCMRLSMTSQTCSPWTHALA